MLTFFFLVKIIFYVHHFMALFNLKNIYHNVSLFWWCYTPTVLTQFVIMHFVIIKKDAFCNKPICCNLY